MLYMTAPYKKISENQQILIAGTIYTQQMVESGKYEGNEIRKPVFFNPKTVSTLLLPHYFHLLKIFFNLIPC